ncbi:MAG: V-type ATP synthase subunit A [Nitrospirae bacterium]|nr:V-type ATP synthase subunit A [Nitrospirota bacterium]
MISSKRSTGRIHRIAGPTVTARGLEQVKLYNRVYVGRSGLLGEVIRIHPDHCLIQVYEETSGLFVGEPVIDTGEPQMVELGPGLLSMIFDGVQRPLRMAISSGPFLERGFRAHPLQRDQSWTFLPQVGRGTRVRGGDIVGLVPAGERGLEHRVMVPPGIEGTVMEVREGPFFLEDTVVLLEDRTPISLLQRWPVRYPRPFRKKLPLDRPLITGQRVLDVLFPVSVGGSVILPGGFGTGKTVLEQSLAKYVHADVVIYVGCGERGNEIADVLKEFPMLTDPYTQRSLMERTILIVNTSNMPVAAREASLYTGMTLAEYYRDMGYQVALMADSTSRWAEALREMTSRMEEMPGEEGYPASLGSCLAQFYDRAGRISCLGSEEREGAVTLCTTVSPPGGDFSEPVTQSSLRVAGAMWALDVRLARQRHYPAIHWAKSFSLYTDRLAPWFQRHIGPDWPELCRRLFELLQREEEIQSVVQLVGPDALQDSEKMILESCRIIREYFLRQNAYTPVDAFCPVEKQYWLLKVFFHLFDRLFSQLKDGTPLVQLPLLDFGKKMEVLRETPSEEAIAKARHWVEPS